MKSLPEIEIRDCALCPRACHADRTRAPGRCHGGGVPRVAFAGPHRWEEPAISGPPEQDGSSGAVFFTGCPLGCLFCQNHAISRSATAGHPTTCEALAETFLSLQNDGAHNLNLVTATHWRPWVLKAVALAKAQGLSLPVVWNTGGYETPEAIAELAGQVSVWLWDVKFSSPELARQLADAPDYPAIALDGLRRAYLVAGPARENAAGLLQSGVVLRVLVLPGHAADAIDTLRSAAALVPPGDIRLSLMRQYTPSGAPRLPKPLRRPLSTREYRKVADEALRLGFTRGWFQGAASASTGYVPPFEA